MNDPRLLPLSRLKALENLFVSQFRAFQALYRLTREEREALIHGDTPQLLRLAERKEALLDRLAALAEERQRLDWPTPNGGGPLPVYPTGSIEGIKRLQRLEEGARILAQQVRDLAQGNCALAACALQQATDMQFILLDDRRADLPALFAAILSARDALNVHDLAAVSAALGDMQNALQQLGATVDETPTKGAPSAHSAGATSPFLAAAPATQPHASLVEKMADLYRQEKAYRAVLRLGNRMLADAS